MTRLAFATLVALGFGAAAAAQQRSAPPHQSHLSFKEADSNGDGRINRSEARAVVGLDFAQADTNGDRVLTRQEFVDALTGSAPTGAGPLVHDASEVPFEQADRNQDGKIDRDEARDIDGLDFVDADSDNDQTLTRAEYRTAMVESRQRG